MQISSSSLSLSLCLDMRLMQGDELRLKYNGGLRTWEGIGHVIKVPNSKSISTTILMSVCSLVWLMKLWLTVCM